MTIRNTPTLGEVFRSALDARLGDVHVAIPARVESYDSGSNRISAQPLIRRGVINEDGERVAERLPIITEVPVIFPGSGGIRIKFPISTGDNVLLIFSESSLDKWLSRGGDVDPLDDRRNSLSDAIAIPGLMHDSDEASEIIDFSSGSVHVGGTPSEPTLKATTYRTAEDVMLTAVAAAFTGLAAEPSLVLSAATSAAAATAIASFISGAAAYPSLIAKVK